MFYIKRLDCLGDICPIPVIKLQNNIGQIKNGEVYLLITDHSCTFKAVSEFCEIHGLSITVKEAILGVWEISISK